jgi:hypothetical protein
LIDPGCCVSSHYPGRSVGQHVAFVSDGIRTATTLDAVLNACWIE